MVGKSTSNLRYIDAAVRRNEGKLCFINRKSKDLVSNCRRFCEKNVSFFEDGESLNKNLWTFFRNAPSFLFFLPAFFEKTPVPSLTVSPTVSSSAQPYARTDTPLRIAHSASSKFLPSPFTFTRKSLIQCTLRVKKRPFFAFTGEGNRGETFTRKSLFPSLLQSYGEEVKAKNEKQRTRALRVRVGGMKWEAGALSRKGFR